MLARPIDLPWQCEALAFPGWARQRHTLNVRGCHEIGCSPIALLGGAEACQQFPLQTRLTEKKKNELTLYKDEIRRQLEAEIVAHFHLDRGRIQAAFKYDDDVKKAIAVLHDQAQYKEVLGLE